MKIAFFLIVLFFCTADASSQTEGQSLKAILAKIEEAHDISFSYVDETIRDIRLDFEHMDGAIEEILAHLEQITQLNFNQLADSRFVTIRAAETKKSVPIYQYLEEVHISNYLTSGISKNSVGAITIETDKFGILPGLIEPDVLQTIQSLPGVLSVSEDVSNISIRGGTPDQNLILYDGIKMYQTGHFFGLISAFNPYLIDKISVFRQGTEAKYGDGVSSVINIELGDKKQDDLEAGVGLNMISLDGFAVVPLGAKIEIQVAARRSVTDIVNTPTYNRYFERVFQDSDLTNIEDAAVSKNENFFFYDTALKLIYEPSEKDKIAFSFLSIYNILDYEEAAIAGIERQASNSTLKQQSLGFGLSYERLWNTRLTTTGKIYYSNYDLEGNNFNILENQRLIQQNKVLDDGVKLGVNYRLNTSFSVNTGLQVSQVSISSLEDINNPEFRNLSKKVLITFSDYIEGTYHSKNKSTSARVGLRHNYLERFGLNLLEPRMHVSQRFLKNFRIDLSGELKSQSTSQVIDLQKDFLGIEKRRWVVSDNDRVPIIKSKQATLGIVYKKNDLLISAEAFVKKVQGITTKSQGFQNQYQFVYRKGNYNIKGVDFLINKKIFNFSTWLSYSLSKNSYNFENLNNNTIFPNNVDISHVVNFSSTYKYNDFKFALGVNWHSAKPVTKPDSESPIAKSAINYQEPNSSRLPDYLRTDFSGTYQFKLGKNKAVVGLSVWNILNQNNIINSYYELDNNLISKVNNRSLKSTSNLNFRLWF